MGGFSKGYRRVWLLRAPTSRYAGDSEEGCYISRVDISPAQQDRII